MRGRLRRCHGRRLGGRAGFGSCDRLLRLAQLALQGFQLGPQRGRASVGNLGQVSPRCAAGARPPVGLEPAANRVDLTQQLDVKLAAQERFRLAHGEAPRRGSGQGRGDARLATKGYVSSGSNCANFLKGYVTIPQWSEPSAVPSHLARTLRVYGIRKATETTDSGGWAPHGPNRACSTQRNGDSRSDDTEVDWAEVASVNRPTRWCDDTRSAASPTTDATRSPRRFQPHRLP